MRCRYAHTSIPWSACWAAARTTSSAAAARCAARSGRQLTITAAGYSQPRVASSGAAAQRLVDQRLAPLLRRLEHRQQTRHLGAQRPSASASRASVSSVMLSVSTAPYG